jgi:hypothetical protein
MTITLTREEAQQVLDALEAALSDDQPYIVSCKQTVETLRARLSAPEPVPTNNGRYLTGYGAQPEPEPVTDKYLMEVECTKCGAKQDGVLTVTVPPQPEPEPVRLRRGDILRRIETNELCTVWATSTTGKTLVKWKANDFGSYTAEQIGDLFWVEPKPECVCGEPNTAGVHRQDGPCYQQPEREWQSLTNEEIMDLCAAQWASHPIDVARIIEAKLKEKNASHL